MLSIFKNLTSVRSELIVDFPKEPRHKNGDANCPKRVTFCAKSTLHMYFYHSDDDEDCKDEQYSSWYDKDDYKSFRVDTQTEILSAISIAEEKKPAFNGNDICMLGIEEYSTKDFFIEDMKRRVAHKNAVFAEQARQLESGIYCEKKLADVSTRHSNWFSMKALINARNARPPDAARKLQKNSRSSRAA